MGIRRECHDFTSLAANGATRASSVRDALMRAGIRARSRDDLSRGPGRLNPILARKITADRERHAVDKAVPRSAVKIAFRLTLMEYLIESQEAFETRGRQRRPALRRRIDVCVGL